MSVAKRSLCALALIGGLFWLLLTTTACGRTAVSAPAPTAAAVAELPLVTDTPIPLPPTPTSTAATRTSTPSPTANHTPTATPTPTAAPDPYADLTIEALKSRSYGGGQLDILDLLEETDEFARYLITYPSDGLDIAGYMNVPHEGSKFPVVIMLHGYIDPDEYETITYTQRYADALAEAGFFVIHPNFRNYPPSDSGPNPFRIGYAVDILNLIAIIQEQSQDPTGYLRRADADHIHLWGHSMGGGVALRVITVNNADYLRSAVLYGSMSGDEAQNFAKIMEWSGGQSGPFELSASTEQLRQISPINYLDGINAVIGVHHSQDDQTVPIAWSEDLCARLEELDHPNECFTYWGIPHTFRGGADELFIERTISFFNRN